MELKIAEWNVAKRSEKKLVDRILKKIETVNADIVILTEVNKNIDYEKLLAEKGYVSHISDKNYNRIMIAVSKEKEDQVDFRDPYDGKTNENHPDSLLVIVKTMKSEPCLKILGIRNQITGMSNKDKMEQLSNLKIAINKNNPDVIIGDFNWYSAIIIPHIEEELEKYIEIKQYKMFPRDNKIYSRIGHVRKEIRKSSPDRVLYREGLVKDKEEPGKNPHYYHQELYDYKPYNNFSEGWPSDHDILVVTVQIPD